MVLQATALVRAALENGAIRRKARTGSPLRAMVAACSSSASTQVGDRLACAELKMMGCRCAAIDDDLECRNPCNSGAQVALSLPVGRPGGKVRGLSDRLLLD